MSTVCCLQFNMLTYMAVACNGVANRVARMEAEAINVAAEEQRAADRIRQIDTQKMQLLQDLNGRAKVRLQPLTFCT